MKNLYKLLFVVGFISLIPLTSQAQCKTFSKKVCKMELLPYVHDGVYNATILSEGESAELYKTFYSGQQYRLAVCGAKELPPIHFQVLDADKNVLYDNAKNKYSSVWDFSLQASQQLMISIQVETSDEVSDEIPSGCVSVLIGFLNEENKLSH